jgi:hypothetical protein
MTTSLNDHVHHVLQCGVQRNPGAGDVIAKTAIENLALIPSNIDLASAETELMGQVNRKGALRGALVAVKGYDFHPDRLPTEHRSSHD